MKEPHKHEWVGVLDPICIQCGKYKIQISSATGKEMCETISKHTKQKPKDIWNYSPTGELYKVMVAYRFIKIKELLQ